MYRDSLRLLCDYDFDVLCPGHENITSRLAKDKLYVTMVMFGMNPDIDD